jgi:hypothetical protein
MAHRYLVEQLDVRLMTTDRLDCAVRCVAAAKRRPLGGASRCTATLRAQLAGVAEASIRQSASGWDSGRLRAGLGELAVRSRRNVAARAWRSGLELVDWRVVEVAFARRVADLMTATAAASLEADAAAVRRDIRTGDEIARDLVDMATLVTARRELCLTGDQLVELQRLKTWERLLPSLGEVAPTARFPIRRLG